MCKMLVSRSRNPVRKQPYKAQIVYYNLPIKGRQLQQKLKEHTKRGAQYLYAYIKKIISTKNCAERTTYSKNHLYNPLFRFFDCVVYTDKAYIDPTSQAQGRILREQGNETTQEY
jgi:hypothetical protein